MSIVTREIRELSKKVLLKTITSNKNDKQNQDHIDCKDKEQFIYQLEKAIWKISNKQKGVYRQLILQISYNIFQDLKTWIKLNDQNLIDLVVKSSSVFSQPITSKILNIDNLKNKTIATEITKNKKPKRTENNDFELEEQDISKRLLQSNRKLISESEKIAEIQNVTFKNMIKNYDPALGINADVQGDIQCRIKSCRSDQVDTVNVQTGSADEPTTVFCRCRECGQHWKIRGK